MFSFSLRIVFFFNNNTNWFLPATSQFLPATSLLSISFSLLLLEYQLVSTCYILISLSLLISTVPHTKSSFSADLGFWVQIHVSLSLITLPWQPMERWFCSIHFIPSPSITSILPLILMTFPLLNLRYAISPCAEANTDSAAPARGTSHAARGAAVSQ